MSWWLTRTLLPALIAAAVLLLVLWPTSRSGHRLLRTWGVPDPSQDQTAAAVGYLWRRRILYVVLFVVVPPLAGLVWREDGGVPAGNIFVPLLAAMLIAELVAAVRPPSGVRIASLVPRSWRDLVPRWAVAVAGLLTVVAVALAVLGLAAQPWADRYAAALPPNDTPQPPTDWQVNVSAEHRAEMVTSTSWFALGNLVVCLATTALLVLLAVRRPAHADEAVDIALRTRSARVGVAIGLGWLGAVVQLTTQRIDFLGALDIADLPGMPEQPGWLTDELGVVTDVVGPVALFGAILCWVWLANPTRRSLDLTRP